MLSYPTFYLPNSDLELFSSVLSVRVTLRSHAEYIGTNRQLDKGFMLFCDWLSGPITDMRVACDGARWLPSDCTMRLKCGRYLGLL